MKQLGLGWGQGQGGLVREGFLATGVLGEERSPRKERQVPSPGDRNTCSVFEEQGRGEWGQKEGGRGAGDEAGSLGAFVGALAHILGMTAATEGLERGTRPAFCGERPTQAGVGGRWCPETSSLPPGSPLDPHTLGSLSGSCPRFAALPRAPQFRVGGSPPPTAPAQDTARSPDRWWQHGGWSPAPGTQAVGGHWSFAGLSQEHPSCRVLTTTTVSRWQATGLHMPS